MGRCVFCKIVAGELPASVVYEDARHLALMDLYPWRPGHVLVIPKAHSVRVRELDEDARARLFTLGARVADAVRASSIPCDDLHFAINDGPASNQSVPHVHLHVLPRTRGDLPRLLLSLATRPLIALRLLRPAPRATLDRQAAELRSALVFPS